MTTLLLPLVLAALPAAAAVDPSARLDFTRSPQQLSEHCAAAKRRAEARLAEVSSLPEQARTFANTPAAIDEVVADLFDETGSDTFSKYVSISSSVRDAANDCETLLGQFAVDVFTREDLYKAVTAYAAKREALAGEDARLLTEQLLDFKRSGVGLPAYQRERVKAIRRKLVQLEADFGKNLNEVRDYAVFTRAELEGLPDDYIAKLKREGEGYRVTVDYPDYYPFMDNAKDPAARRRLEALFSNRAYPVNAGILQEVLALRREAAGLLGYKNHAAFIQEDRMAKTPDNVSKFLSRLIRKLRPLGKKELAEMVALKDKELGAASDHAIHAWDWRYYDNMQLKQRAVDKEKIKQYFPLETVTRGMLDVYQKLLGVRFREVSDAAQTARWHPEAKLFEIADADDGQVLAYFYMDLFPREGKYKHAAAFDIVRGRRLADGRYQKPVSAMVANFNKPAPGQPSLLKHGSREEVETYFHEFGHIMHQTLTKAAHGRFSGLNTARDFVEAPSQMLENWVWDPKILASLSGRYDDPSQKLPPELLEKMLAVKNLDVGLKTLRQLLFGSVDMAYHTRPVDDPTAVWAKHQKEIMLVPATPGTHPEASFGHLMGYDAGYYGYLWSQVYADDMFSVFEREGLLNPAVGRRYRSEILERGSSRDEQVSLEAFLGRKPSEDAFLRHIGLGPESKGAR
jgi:thimet oligopeptidase